MRWVGLALAGKSRLEILDPRTSRMGYRLSRLPSRAAARCKSHLDSRPGRTAEVRLPPARNRALPTGEVSVLRRVGSGAVFSRSHVPANAETSCLLPWPSQTSSPLLAPYGSS